MKVWKDVVGYVGIYQVNAEGEVLSVNRFINGGRKVQERYLRKPTDSYGYESVVLHGNGKPKTKRVHRIVAEAFLKAQSHEEVDHINSDRTDNRLENLRLTTKQGNTVYREKKLKEFAAIQSYRMIDADSEEWRKIRGFENYSVSSFGSVRNDVTGRILKNSRSNNEKAQVNLFNEKRASTFNVSALVAEAFLIDEHDYEDCLIKYKDDDKSNTRADNLYYSPRNYFKHAHLLAQEQPERDILTADV